MHISTGITSLSKYNVGKGYRSLYLHRGDSFKGLDIPENPHCPVIYNYLDQAHNTIEKALVDYSEVYCLRFDLYYPDELQGSNDDSSIVKAFIDSFKATISAHQKRVVKRDGRVNKTKVRYVYCKEVSNHRGCHFHFVIILNKAAYSSRGNYSSDTTDNISNRIHNSWYSALKKHMENSFSMKGLVNFPDKGSYYVKRGDSNAMTSLLSRVSYLCKPRSKNFKSKEKPFSTSRA